MHAAVILAQAGADELVLGAGKQILGIYIVGPICIALVALCIFLDKRVTAERARGDALQERLLATTKEIAAIGEESRKTTENQVEALRGALELLKERGR